jgi:hypothetical protein
MMMMFKQDSTDAPPTTPLGASPTGSPSGVSLLLFPPLQVERIPANR